MNRLITNPRRVKNIQTPRGLSPIPHTVTNISPSSGESSSSAAPFPANIPITAFINQLSDAVIVTDKALHITYWNEAAEHIYGWTSAEAVGHSLDDLLHTEWLFTPQAEAVEALLKTGVWHGTIQQTTQAGAIVQIKSAVSWLKDATGEIVGGITINRDIGDEIAAQAAREERRRLEIILSQEQTWNATIRQLMRVMFHDMRVPLTVINTSSGMLNRHYAIFTPEQRLEKLNSIYAQVRHMNEMIDHASQLVKGSIGAESYRPRNVNLNHLCEVCVREIRDALASQHTVTFKTDGLVGRVEVDEMLITRVLVNLLSNALKYSPDTSEVTLGLYKSEDTILIQVSDEGMGISEDDQAHLFEPFFRSEQVKDIDGTGLGLSIVRDCVALHHGTISVESAVGKGSTFTLRLPFIPILSDSADG